MRADKRFINDKGYSILTLLLLFPFKTIFYEILDFQENLTLFLAFLTLNKSGVYASKIKS